MKIAFFDFDGTLTRHDTFLTFSRFSVGNRRLLTALAKAAPILLLWKLGIKTNSEAKEKLFGYLFRGMRYTDFKQDGVYFATEINKDLRKEVKAILDAHMTEGRRVFIVSASIREWIEPWATSVGIEDVIATRVEVDRKGRLTGRFSTPNCDGEEKALRIRRHLPDLSTAETWAYGNSAGDTAMLALATHGIIT